jgi:hypothetical protein
MPFIYESGSARKSPVLDTDVSCRQHNPTAAQVEEGTACERIIDHRERTYASRARSNYLRPSKNFVGGSYQLQSGKFRSTVSIENRRLYIQYNYAVHTYVAAEFLIWNNAWDAPREIMPM